MVHHPARSPQKQTPPSLDSNPPPCRRAESNMEYAAAGIANYTASEMTNHSGTIRLFHVGHAKEGSPQPEVPCTAT